MVYFYYLLREAAINGEMPMSSCYLGYLLLIGKENTMNCQSLMSWLERQSQWDCRFILQICLVSLAIIMEMLHYLFLIILCKLKDSPGGNSFTYVQPWADVKSLFLHGHWRFAASDEGKGPVPLALHLCAIIYVSRRTTAQFCSWLKFAEERSGSLWNHQINCKAINTHLHLLVFITSIWS